MNEKCMGGVTLAVCEHGRVAVVKSSEGRVELYGGGDGGDTRPVNQMITQNLVTPYSVCFAPNNHLVVTDTGDKSIKVYSLEGEPQIVGGIICHQRRGKIIIETTNKSSPSSSPLETLTPFNIIVGPSPLSQLFIVFECNIFVLTIDWCTVELLDYQELCSPRDWSSVQLEAKQQCTKASIVHDHADNHKVGGQNPLAITKAQFCAMFYHVTQRRQDKINYKCLHRKSCRVGKMAMFLSPKTDYAATVVVYVRLTDRNDRLIFHARYGNCSESKRRNTIHAEYFMLMDEEFRQAVKRLCDQKDGNINLFMNKQPCYRSTRHHGRIKRKECAQDLVNFYNLYCSAHGITFIINLCQLYKVDMHNVSTSSSLDKDIQNAKQGMRRMISAGIVLKPMSEESWGRLASYADIKLPEYDGSERQKLDQHINKFIQGLGTL